MIKKLRCIKPNIRTFGELTIDKIYDFDDISEEEYLKDAYVGSYSCYYIKGDDNQYTYYDKECFIDIEQDRDNKLNQLGI